MSEAMSLLEAEIVADKVQLTLGNVTDLPYRDDSIDTVFHCNNYYFWDDRPLILKGILRVLKPNGKMITALNIDALKLAGQRGLLTEEQFNPEVYMEQLKASGFKDVDIRDYVLESLDYKCQVITGTKEGCK